MVEGRQLHNMIKKFIYVVFFCSLTQVSFAAGDSSSGSDSDNYSNPYKDAQNPL